MLLSTAEKVLNRIILERLKVELDKRLRDEQAVFQDHCGAVSRVELSRLRNLC